VYALPLHRETEIVGALAVFHDTGYIEAQSSKIWRETFLRALAQVVFIVLLTLLIVRWTISRPIARTAEWMRKMRTGKESHREPHMHVRQGRSIEAVVPASGLVTAIEPILRACHGTWVAHGGGDADRETVDERDHLRVPPEDPQYTLRRVWLTKEEEEGYYFGFANEGLWPLCHIAHTRPIFRVSDWEQYQGANRKFAEALLEE